MKTILSIVACTLLVGCSTITKQDACNTAQAAYAAYLVYQQAQINGGKPPSQDQILAAQAAAAVLTTQCGWTPPAAFKAIALPPPNDRFGVPIILPPAK